MQNPLPDNRYIYTCPSTWNRSCHQWVEFHKTSSKFIWISGNASFLRRVYATQNESWNPAKSCGISSYILEYQCRDQAGFGVYNPISKLQQLTYINQLLAWYDTHFPINNDQMQNTKNITAIRIRIWNRDLCCTITIISFAMNQINVNLWVTLVTHNYQLCIMT